MDETIIELIGFLAAVISFVLFLPQAVRTWKVRKSPTALAGISVGTQLLILCNASLWGLYAFITGAFWVGAPGLLNAPLAILTIIFITKAKGLPQIAEDFCNLCSRSIPHDVFITAPPGWGSVMPCSEHTRANGIIVTDKAYVETLRTGEAY